MKIKNLLETKGFLRLEVATSALFFCPFHPVTTAIALLLQLF